ncbi:MAG TPA: hypothetical protein PLR57_06155, partial [Clostridia bacterium]|nr:hypothetical protein [Clostridia bacterium]
MTILNVRSLIALFCALALGLSALSDCAAQTSTESTATLTDTAQQTTDSSATYVQVQSIENGTITALIGTLSQNAPGGQQGTPPSGDNANGTQGTPPEMPSGDSANNAQGTAPSGDSANGAQGSAPQQPSGDNANGQQGTPPSGGATGGMGGFTAGTETLTFTVSSATAITLADGTTGTIDSIAAGDVLAITLSSANVAETITVQSLGMPQDMNAGGQPGANFGGSSEVTNGTSANTIGTDSTVTDETYTSSGDDENALRIDGAVVTLDGITVSKTGGASSNT